MTDRASLSQPDRRIVLAGGATWLAMAPRGAGAQEGRRLLRWSLAAFEHPLAPNAPPSRLFAFVPEGEPPSPAPPILRVRAGERVDLELRNALPVPVALHARGLRGAAGNGTLDGVAGRTEPPIAPGETRLYRLPNAQAGMYLLSNIDPASAPETAARGLCAVLIVEEATPPPVAREAVLVFADRRVDSTNRLMEGFDARRERARVGRLGNRLVANGVEGPMRLALPPGGRLRLRLVNAASARMAPLSVTGLDARVIAVDSTPCLPPFDPLKRTVTLAPGTRAELMLDAPAEAGREGQVIARIGEGLPLAIVTTEGAALPPPAPVAPLPDPGLPPAIRLQDAVRADVRITGGAPREPLPPSDAAADEAALAARFPDRAAIYAINGTPNAVDGPPLARVRRGRALVLALFNDTAWPQVIAVHGHAFRLLHPYDDGWEPYFLDTLLVPAGTVARIALVAETPGKWAVRATIADHLAGGVRHWFEVTA